MLTSTSLSLVLALGASVHADAGVPDKVLEDVRAGRVQAERVLTIVPLERPADAPTATVRVADVSDPDVEIAPMSAWRPDRMMAMYRGDTPRVLIPGHVVESRRRSFAVTSYAMTHDGRPTEIDLAELSGDTEHDMPRIAFRTLPPTLRWMALTQPNSGELIESMGLWTRRWNTPDDEESLDDLAASDVMEKRVRGYVDQLRELRPSSDDRVVVGYIARLDDDVALVEVFGRHDDFATHWPSAVRALAIEAVLSERNEGWLNTSVHADATPEFDAKAADALMEELAAAEFERERLGHELILRTAGDSNQATRLLTTEKRELVHFVHAPDAKRRTAPTFDDLEPADDRTEERATGDLERMTERREDAAERAGD